MYRRTLKCGKKEELLETTGLEEKIVAWHLPSLRGTEPRREAWAAHSDCRGTPAETERPCWHLVATGKTFYPYKPNLSCFPLGVTRSRKCMSPTPGVEMKQRPFLQHHIREADQNHTERALKTQLSLETQPTKVDYDLFAKTKRVDYYLK